jgi:hypothetical protein
VVVFMGVLGRGGAGGERQRHRHQECSFHVILTLRLPAQADTAL